MATNQIASSKQQWYCSDIGSAIVVKGAGTAGADLTTTIASLPSCNGVQGIITLSAAASTAVTNALVYTSIPGVSATQTIGNCAIAGDNFDGNSAHYAAGWNASPNSPKISNVTINSVSGVAQNHSCGIFWQGIWQPYQLGVDHLNIFRIAFAVVQAGVDTAPLTGINGQDQQWWKHMNISSTYPWISYNGGFDHISQWQLSGPYGPFILTVTAGVEGNADDWEIQVPEDEQLTRAELSMDFKRDRASS